MGIPGGHRPDGNRHQYSLFGGKKEIDKSEEIAQWLGPLAAPAKDPSSVFTATRVVQDHLQLQFLWIQHLLALQSPGLTVTRLSQGCLHAREAEHPAAAHSTSLAVSAVPFWYCRPQGIPREPLASDGAGGLKQLCPHVSEGWRGAAAEQQSTVVRALPSKERRGGQKLRLDH